MVMFTYLRGFAESHSALVQLVMFNICWRSLTALPSCFFAECDSSLYSSPQRIQSLYDAKRPLHFEIERHYRNGPQRSTGGIDEAQRTGAAHLGPIVRLGILSQRQEHAVNEEARECEVLNVR